MLSLPTLNWALLDRWHTNPETFTSAEFLKLRASGNVFHPAVAFDTPQLFEITRAWFRNRLIEHHPDYFLRIDRAADLQCAKAAKKIGIILGMQDSIHLRTKDDVDTFYAMGQRLTQLTSTIRKTASART